MTVGMVVLYACDKNEGKGGGGRTNVCGGESVRRMREEGED